MNLSSATDLPALGVGWTTAEHRGRGLVFPTVGVQRQSLLTAIAFVAALLVARSNGVLGD